MKQDNALKKLILYPILLVIFCSLNKVYGNAPFACGAYVGFLCLNAPIVATSLIFIVSFLIYKEISYLICALFFAAAISFVFLLSRRKKKRLGAETVIFIFIGFLGFLLKDFPSNTIEKLIYMSIIAIFSLICQTVTTTIFYKKLNQSTTLEEGGQTVVFALFLFVGFINLFGIKVYKPLSVVIFALLSRYYKNHLSLIVAMVLAIPAVYVTGKFQYLASYILFYAAFTISKNQAAIIISACLAVAELLSGVFLQYYGTYGYIDAIPTLTVLFLTSLISKRVTDDFSKKYNFDPEIALIRSAINRNRADTSAKLYDVSNVFFQMQTAFKDLKKCTESTDVLVEKMTDEVLFSMCSTCQIKQRCEKLSVPKRETVEKIIRIGIAKGRITIVDLPRDFTNVCGYPNSIIFEVNRLIGAYYEYTKNAECGDKSKEILSLQSSGVAGVLKGLAFSLSKNTTENKDEEKRIIKILARCGIKCEGALCFGEGKDTEIQILISTKYYAEADVSEILSKAFNQKFTTSRLENVASGINALTLKFAPRLDAAFGISKITKTGSSASGDCYSLIKVDESNFLIALSDGMGSGDTAEKTSETALNLIESLYKAGLSSEFILTLVNKLLAISLDDNFSAIDIALVNLREGDAAFVKIGSPYGFIVSDNGIRFIEGSSLPLGILDELHPTTSETPLSSGDVIIMLSDGVTDAFSSSSELIDFLKSAPIRNPQELADALIQKALFLCNGIAEDDMSAVCVRIIDAA